MDKGKPRLARLTAIITQLQSKNLVTASQIATKHDVSIRTVYRDIRTLEQSGVPIVTEEGSGYRLMQGFKLPPIMFSEAEANALITAAEIIRKNKDASLVAEYNNAIEKILAVFNYSQKDKSALLSKRIQVRLGNEAQKNSSYLVSLQTAITDFQLLDLEYQTVEGKASKRKIEPFALLHTQNNWVLIAYCHLRTDFRAFRLDRISRLQKTGMQFEPHKMSLQDYFKEAAQKWIERNKT